MVLSEFVIEILGLQQSVTMCGQQLASDLLDHPRE